MKSKISIKFLASCFFLAVVIFCYAPLRAETFTISYSLTEGGSRLELNPENAYKGVKIDVSNDVGVRYEVQQRILQPFENKDKPGTFIKDNLVVRSINAAQKSSAVLYVPPTDIPVRNYDRFYTSNPAGEADSFTLVYGLINSQDIEPGRYQGQIGFTLQPINSTRQEVTKYLYVDIVVRDTETKTNVEISTATGARVISLDTRKDETKNFYVNLKLKGEFKRTFSISEALITPLESADGIFEPDKINFQVLGAKKGMGAPVTKLTLQPQTVYTCGPAGQFDTDLVINYSLGEVSDQKAGKYSSTIQYYFEQEGRFLPLNIFRIEIEIDPVFELTITPENQKSLIEFRDLMPGTQPKINKMEIKIKTNKGKPYQVSQNVFSELTNKEGNTISFENFTVKTEGLEKKGTLKIPEEQAVKKGDTVLYTSDNKGSPDEFKVVYELNCPDDVKAGDYSTRITYSLVEI